MVIGYTYTVFTSVRSNMVLYTKVYCLFPLQNKFLPTFYVSRLPTFKTDYVSLNPCPFCLTWAAVPLLSRSRLRQSLIWCPVIFCNTGTSFGQFPWAHVHFAHNQDHSRLDDPFLTEAGQNVPKSKRPQVKTSPLLVKTSPILVKTSPVKISIDQNVPTFGQNVPTLGQNVPTFSQNVPIFMWDKYDKQILCLLVLFNFTHTVKHS